MDVRTTFARRFRTRPALCLAAAMVLAVVVAGGAPARAQGTLDPLDTLIVRIAADHERFAADADTLSGAMAAFCQGNGSEAEARDAFVTAAGSYQAVQWAQIGPAVLFDRRYRVNFWPDENNAISRQLAAAAVDQPPELLTPDGIGQASVALQGLPALERLLYSQPRAEPGSYSCDLAVAIADNVATIAAGTAADWQDPSRMPGMTDADNALGTILGAVLANLEVVADRKIARVAGTSVDEVRPRRAESWRSGRSLAHIATNLSALHRLLDEGADAPLGTMLSDAGHPEVFQDWANLMARAVALSAELADRTMEEVATTEDGHARLLELRAAISAARREMGEDVFPALGLSVGFNSLDGD